MRLLIFSLLVGICCWAAPPSNRVIGGSEAAIEDWPWQLSLHRFRSGGYWSHTCGATLIHPKWALCAAHCIDGSTTASLKVYAGLENQLDTSEAQEIMLSSMVMHANYTPILHYANDISILELSENANIGSQNIEVVRIPATGRDFDGMRCAITGWGKLAGSDSGIPNQLQQGATNIGTDAQCDEAWDMNIWAGQICIYDYPQNDTGVCNGDSGGPVQCFMDDVQMWEQAGVASFVHSTNCDTDWPNVFTRVSHYRDWICANTNGDVCESNT